MAQNIGEAQINLSVNTSQMEREVSAALKRLETKGFNLGGGINAKAFTQPLGRITGAANEFQKSLDASNARVIAFGASAGAIYNVQRAFTALIGSTIEVQKSLTDINVILNASNKTLAQFGDQLFQIARDTGQAFSTVATAAGELARQGLTIEQTLKRTSDALVLARLSGLDAASSVEALTASINSFNNAALDSTQIVNKLASVDAAFAVSSADLAEALKRVGSSAQDVGVSFDELLAIVASVNQTTARGGAVIGNSLKTIFTRVQRTDVLDQLESLGIAVRDLQGNTIPAIQVLTGLAQKFDQLGSAQRSQVAELVGGVFQINVLKAALGDLSREYSIYGNALKVATSASDEAIRRNEELNKTLAALVNRTVANLTKVGSEIGALSFAPAIERVLGSINTVLEGFDFKGDSIGSKIGRGIFEGIGSFISGPGIALLIGVFIKIFGDLAKFTIEASKTILSLNKSSQAQAQIQERINNILAQNPQLVQNILNKQVSLLQVEKDILTVIQAQAQARQQSAAVAATITRGLVGRGITSEKGVITPRTKSQGFIPNFNANKEIMGAIAGGYMPGQVRSMNIPNYGRVTYNTAEEVKRFQGLSQPGIMPPERSDAGKAYKQKFKDKYGIDPYASKGFIPNFASRLDILQKPYPFTAVSSKDRRALSRQFKADEESRASTGYGKATEKGNIINSRSIDKYGLIYPSFSQSAPARAVGTSGGNKYGFVTYPFPGNNFDINEELYENVRKNLIDISSNYFRTLITKPKIIDTTRFKTNIASNLSRSAVESSLGQVFEAGIKSSISSLTLSEIANFDLNKGELSAIQKRFKLPYGGFGNTYLADLKNSLSSGNLDSLAGKIAVASGEKISGQDTIRARKTQARLQEQFSKRGYIKLSGEEAQFVKSGRFKSSGFIPNFSPLQKAFSTEKSLGGKPVLDYKDGLGLYVRDGKTQPNFAAVMRDHPEGLQKATKNSKEMQKLMSGGFVPNYAPLDPATLFYLTSSLAMGSQMNQGSANLQLAEKRLGELLNQRGEIEYQILNTSRKGKKNRERITQLEAQRVQVEEEITAQRGAIRSQTPIFARRGGQFVGGVGGVASRFGARYGAGLALAAPLLTGVASQFVGDEYTREGRGTRAVVGGLGTVASFAGLGAMVGGGIPGAVGGAALGGIIATYDAIKQFKDVMPEVARNVELATEKFNGITASTQAINVALESLRNAQENTSLSADTRAQLITKANQDFAEGLSKLAEISKEKTEEIVNLYSRMGDTAEVRTKIAMLQGEAKKELDIETARLNLLKANESFKTATDPGFFNKARASISRAAPNLFAELGLTESGSYEDYLRRRSREKKLNPMEERQMGEAARSVSENLYSTLQNVISRRQGAPAGTRFELNLQDIQGLQEALRTGGIDNLKKAIVNLSELDSEAEFINFQLDNIEPDLLAQALEKLNFKIKTIDEITRAREDLERREAAGTARITSPDQLQRLFNRGQISPEAMQNIDYESIFGKTSNLQGQYNQLVGQEAMKNLMDLNTELANSPDKLKLLQAYTEEVARVQDDLSKGIITTSQAFDRLKNKVDSLTFDKLAKGMFTGERADARQSQLQNLLKQGDLTAGFQPLLSFYDRLGDNAITTADKINKSFANLAENMQTGFEDAFGAFLDGTKTAEDAFRDFALSLAQQTIKEQFSIGFRSILGQLTGGGGAGTGYGGAGPGGLFGSLFGGLFGLGKAKGGPVKKYSGGGYVDGGSGIRDDVPAMLTDGEYVLRKSAVNKYGIGALNMLNNGGMIKGYAGGGGIEGMGIRGADRSASAFIRSLFYNGNNVSSYLNDPFLQANNRMVFRGGKGGGMLSKPVPFEMQGIRGKALHSTPLFPQAAGYAEDGFGMSFRNVTGKSYSIGSGNNMPFTRRSNMVQSFYNLEDRLVMRPGSGGSVYGEAMGRDVSGIKVKDFLNARVSDRVLNNLSSEQKALTLMKPYDGLELNAIGGRRGQAFLTRNFGEEAVRLPGFLRKQIDKEIKYAKISSPGYMSKTERGAFFDSLTRAKGARGVGSTASFFEDLNLAAKFSKIGNLTSPLLKTGGKMLGVAGGIFGNLDLFDQAMGELGFFAGGGNNSMSKGGRIKGYATGGSINSLLANAYDFFGPEGDRLTGSFSPEAFKTEVKGPEELGNVPALTGRFNISDFLSSRAITNEDNPMNALREQRFMGMQNYQQQVSNFKTSYNEQMRQVEELRRQEQERVNQINAANRAAYNAQRSQLLIGGLIGAGTSLFGGLAGSGQFPALSKIGGFLGLGGGGGGGGGGYNIFGDIFNRGLNFLQQGLTGGFSPNYATSGKSPFDLTEDQRKQMAKSIESGQFRGGMQDPFFQQAQLFPQFGRNQTGIGYGPGGFSMQPSSSFGGFQYNVGVGTPAGFQTQTQSIQDYYRVNFASPVSPISPGRGNLMVATNPYDNRGSFYTNAFGGYGFAKGGLVRGYQMGGMANEYLPSKALNLKIKGPGGKTFTLAQMGLTTTNTYADLQRMGGQAFGGGYNSPELVYLMNEMQGALGSQFNRITAINDLYHMTRRAPGTSHRTGYKADFTLNDYKNGKENIINFLKERGLKQGQDYTLTFEGPGTPGSTGTHFDFKLNDNGITKIASMMTGMPAENIAMMQTNRPVIAGSIPSRSDLTSYLDLPLNTSFPGANTNIAGTNISTVGPQVNPFSRTNPVARALTPTGPSILDRPYIGSRGSTGPLPRATSAFPSRGVLPSMGGRGMLPTAPVQPQTANFPSRGVLPSMGNRGPLPQMNVPGPYGPSRVNKPYVGSRGSRIGSLSGNRMLFDPDIAEYLKSPSQLYQEAAQNSLLQLPFFQSMQTGINRVTGIEPSLYQTVGSLLDTKNRGMYGNLASRFAPFYTGQQGNRLINQPSASNFGQVGFNNYLKYLGLNPFSTTLNQLNAFRAPLTPSTLGFNAFGFSSRYFSGFGGFGGTGVPFASSNYFGTGSRLGIQPNWVARATGGAIYGGSSYKDDVPAMLMGGEYVIRKDVVDRMGQPFFDKLNRGQVSGFADGGPVGTSLPAIGTSGAMDSQDNSKTQFVEALMKLLKSLDQLNRSVEEQTRETKSQNENASQTTDQVSSEGGGVTNNINISVNVDQGGQVTNDKSTESQENQDGGGGNDQERFKKTLERSRVLSEMLRQQVLKVIVEEQRPGGVLYQGSKGRDLGR